MADLCDLSCEACRADAPTVSPKDQELLLNDIEGWSINTDPCDMLVKKFNFDDYESALSFTNAVAEMAEDEGHHPKLILEWGLVYVKLMGYIKMILFAPQKQIFYTNLNS